MNNFSKNIVQTLLIISENTIPFTTSTFFKCFKVVMYILQLYGYVYSQYETKPLTTPELNYLAQFTQLSPGTFALLQYQNDQLTRIFFYLIFSIHVSIYLIILYLASKKETNHSWIYKTLNFFFINFMWMFMTPFQEICIGMIVCGKNSFLSYNVEDQNCSSNNPLFQYIIGISGIGLVTFSGFITVYFFRDYQFFNLTFARRFSIITYSRLLSHQLIQICYYLYLPSLNYIKHALTHMLMLNIVFDSLSSFPFGFFFEAKFFSAAMSCSEYFMLLLTIWLFSDLNSNILFLSFLAFQPIIVMIALMLNDNQRISLIANFNPQVYNENSTVYLEEVYRCASTYYYSVESKVQFLYILKSHTDKCQSSNCLCGLDVMNFIDASNNVNWKKLNEWTQQIFDQILKLSLNQKEYDDFQHFALKYSTFLQEYKNNPILSYAILQDILISQSNMKQKQNQIHFKPSFFFTEIINQIQHRNIQQIKIINSKTSKLNLLEFKLLQNINCIEDYGELLQYSIINLLQEQIKFWNKLIQSQITSFDQLKENLQLLFQQKQQCKQYYQQIDTHAQSQLLIRFQLIYCFCCERDYESIQKHESNLNQIVLTETLDQVSCFKAAQFLAQSSYTLIGSISPQYQGQLLNKINQNFLRFFSYEHQSDHLLNLNNLMPEMIGKIHKNFIEQFLNDGQTHSINKQFTSYILNGLGFVEQVKVLLDFYFPHNNKSKSFLMMSHIKKSNLLKADITDLETNEQLEGIILLDQDFKILNLTQNIYDKVSSYLLHLKSTQDIQRYSNIFRMIPTLFTHLTAYYNQNTNSLNEGTQEIANFSDMISTNYDSEFHKLRRKLKINIYSHKERIKCLNFYKQNHAIQNQRQINSLPIECQVNQNVINYLQQGTQKQLLYYELIIKFKQDATQLKSVNSCLQILNFNCEITKLDTGRVYSMDNIDISEVPILSNDEVEMQNNENNSISSLKSGVTDTKQLKNFQKFVKGNQRLRVIHEFTIGNFAFIFSFLCFAIIMLILRYTLLHVSTDTIIQQFNFQQDYISSINIMNLQKRQLFIEEQSQEFQKIDLTSILNQQSILGSQLTEINNLQMNLYIDEWVNNVYINYLDHNFQLRIFSDIPIENKIQDFNSSLLEYVAQINNYIFFYNQSYKNNLVDKTLFAQLILNYEELNRINQEFLNNEKLDGSSNQIKFQLFATFVCVFIVCFFIFSLIKNIAIMKKLNFLLSAYLSIDVEQIQQEIDLLDLQQAFMKTEQPWTKEKSFQQFLQESNSFIGTQQKSSQAQSQIQSVKKLDLVHKQTKIKIENQKLSIGKLIAYILALLVINIIIHLIIWIKFTYSYSSPTTKFETVFETIEFQIKYCDFLTFWDLYLQNVTFQDSQNNKWYSQIYQQVNLNATQLNLDFNKFKSIDFEQFRTVLDSQQNLHHVCDYYTCNKLNYWQSMPLSDQLLIPILSEGLTLNLQKVLNFISLQQGFEFHPTTAQLMAMYFQQDYFIYFHWANDIILTQIDIIVSNELSKIKEQNDYSLLIDTVLIVSLLCILTIVNIIIVYKQNRDLIFHYQSLLDTLIFIPFNAQSRLMPKNFLAKLKQ